MTNYFDKFGYKSYNQSCSGCKNNRKTINSQTKKIFIKATAIVLKIAGLALTSLDKILKLSKVPFLSVSKIIYRLIILPNFGRYLWFKAKILKKTSNRKQRIILAFTNRYVIHLIVLMIALGIAASNLLAYENKDDYGQNALVYKIVGLENIEIIEDTATVADDPKIYSYLGEGSGVSANVFTESQKREEDIYAEQTKAGPGTTGEGVALIKPDLASTEAAKITTRSIRKYTVTEGDAISSIARGFGISVDTVLWANNLTVNSYIKAGQELIIPPTSGVLHLIKKGDTLKSIAAKYDANETKIREFNNVDDNGLLAAGEDLMVPGGRIIYTSKPRTYVAPSNDSGSYTAPAVVGGQMVWPSVCRRITQYYRGWRHTGVDIACTNGSAIRAAEAGVVTRVQYAKYGYGYNAVINHGNGKQTLYAHASFIYVEVGQQVKKGEVIAKEGSTGRSTGPHLHFEVIVNGSKVNPLNYIK